MRHWYKQFINSTRETKMFIFQSVIYMFLIIATTVYCYARLDYVRSYAKVSDTEAKQKKR